MMTEEEATASIMDGGACTTCQQLCSMAGKKVEKRKDDCAIKNMEIDWRRKLSSRKFLAAVAGVIISVMVTFNVDAVTQERVAGVISAAGTLVIYMLAEGAADKAAVKKNKEE